MDQTQEIGGASFVDLGHDRSALTNRESSERAYTALELCGIEPLKDRMPATLSGGQQQRVALARALANCSDSRRKQAEIRLKSLSVGCHHEKSGEKKAVA